MIFSKKKVITAYTVEQCMKCGMLTKRGFVKGDVLFADISDCGACKGRVRIAKIFGETLT